MDNSKPYCYLTRALVQNDLNLQAFPSDSQQKPIDKVHGSALFFALSLQHDNSLLVHCISKDRICPEEANEKLTGSKSSGLIYLEFCNYFHIPKTNKGLFCAFECLETNGVWKLAFVHSVEQKNRKCYCWCEMDLMLLYLYCLN
jgi:hypothetical protein